MLKKNVWGKKYNIWVKKNLVTSLEKENLIQQTNCESNVQKLLSRNLMSRNLWNLIILLEIHKLNDFYTHQNWF